MKKAGFWKEFISAFIWVRVCWILEEKVEEMNFLAFL
jgi:hypothetical protein